ncbi:hypothetical protein ACOMHN_052863 [Nucella lapillus]
MKRQIEGARRRRMQGGAPWGQGGIRGGFLECGRVVVILVVLSELLLFSSAEELPRILRHPQSATIAAHHPLNLSCRAHPPSATVAWLYNRAPLLPSAHPGLQVRGSELHFGHFRHGSAPDSSSNDGEYRCTATTSAGTVVSRPAVLSKPVLRAFPRSEDIVIEALSGGFTTIPCTAPYSLPPASLSVLTSSGHPLDESQDNVLRLPSGSVVLRSVAVGAADNYTCVAHNPVSGRNRSASHRIRLSVLPSTPGAVSEQRTVIVDRSTPSLQVREGGSVVLECPVSGVGNPAVSWTRGYGTMPHGHSLGPFGNLHISSVKLRDGGTYICQTPKGQKRQVFLQVQMGPAVERHPTAEEGGGGVMRAREGEDVRLVCKGGGLPAPAVSWFHDGAEVVSASSAGPSVSSVGEVHSLQLQGAREEDGGLYVCELSNSVGQDSAVIQLIVTRTDRQWHAQKDNPSDVSSEESPAGEVTPADSEERGSKRNFHLEVANNNQQRHNRKRKKNGRKKNKKRKNKNKGKSRKVKLVPPSAPTVSRLSETSVLVHWTVPENDGLDISLFRVQYREVRPNNGQWQTVEDDISYKALRYKVTRLKAGGTYKFRIAAVYSNNDNRNSPNSRRFHLAVNPFGESRPPTLAPRVVEAKPFIYQNIYAIGIKWQYIPVDGSSITGFYIHYKPYGSQQDFRVETLLGAGIRNHLLTDLTADTEYSIKMQCFNTAGASDFSNIVVKRTLPLEGQAPAEPPTPALPPSEDEKTVAPPSSRGATQGLEQPVILGIVLGGLLLLLAVFLAMCWWKHRQQKRRNQSLDSSLKYPGDPATHTTLYSDSLRGGGGGKVPNGGGPPFTPLHGLNGVTRPNGHGPLLDQVATTYNGSVPHPTVPTQGGVLEDPRQNQHLQQSVPSSHRDMYSAAGKPYYHGNGKVLNGTVPGYGHSGSSDNNFNKIRQTHSTDNMMVPSGYLPNGIHSSATTPLHCHGQPSKGGYPVHHPYPPPPPSVSSFTSSHHPHHRHNRRRQRDPSYSQEEPDSPEELEPLTRGGSGLDLKNDLPSAYFCVSGRTSVPLIRDNADNSHERGYGYGGSYPLGSRSERRGEGSRSRSSEWRGEEGGGVHAWSAPHPPPSQGGSSSHSGRHKRRRRRNPAAGEQREQHTMRDQATNTDLSSNGEEGSTGAGRGDTSPAGSLSNGSDSSPSSHSDTAGDTSSLTLTCDMMTCGDRLISPVTVPPVVSL